MVDRKTINNWKAKARAELDSAGHSFDALGKYKEKVSKQLNSDFLIYKVNNRKLDPSLPSFIFKTGRSMLEINARDHAPNGPYW